MLGAEVLLGTQSPWSPGCATSNLLSRLTGMGDKVTLGPKGRTQSSSLPFPLLLGHPAAPVSLAHELFWCSLSEGAPPSPGAGPPSTQSGAAEEGSSRGWCHWSCAGHQGERERGEPPCAGAMLSVRERSRCKAPFHSAEGSRGKGERGST